MSFCIAIHPDDYTNPVTAPCADGDAAAPRWAALLREAGHEVRSVDVFQPDVFEQLRGCDGLMWRWNQSQLMSRLARRLWPVLEDYLRLSLYPDLKTCWHYDDKVAQQLLFQALDIPAPKAWIWFDRGSAEAWAATAPYPVVFKLPNGAASENVRLVKSEAEARRLIARLFEYGAFSSTLVALPVGSWRERLRLSARMLLKGTYPALIPLPAAEYHRNLALFQEFLPGNEFDTRITVIGNRAFGFRRFNRPNDFRASGSGKIDWNPEAVDERFVRLAFHTAQRLGMQSCAIDGLYRQGQPVTAEVSYTYVSWAVQRCPGHWVLGGAPATGRLTWTDGQMWPEQAQAEDFLAKLEGSRGTVTA